MIYSVLIRNNAGRLKRQPAGKKAVELRLHADSTNQNEGLNKKTFLRYFINEQGQQVVELFGSEEILLVVDDYRVITNGNNKNKT